MKVIYEDENKYRPITIRLEYQDECLALIKTLELIDGYCRLEPVIRELLNKLRTRYYS